MVNWRRMKLLTSYLISGKSVELVLIGLMVFWLEYYRGGFEWLADPKNRFNWHPMLMLASMLILYGNGIQVYRALTDVKRYKVKLIHAGIHLSVFIIAVIGLKAVFDSHSARSIPHLYSLHSWIGIVAVAVFAIQLLVGYIFFLTPFLPATRKAQYRPVHIYCGIIAFVLSTIAILLGLFEKAQKAAASNNYFGSEAVLINIMSVLVLAHGITVASILVDPSFKRVDTNEDQTLLESKE